MLLIFKQITKKLLIKSNKCFNNNGTNLKIPGIFLIKTTNNNFQQSKRFSSNIANNNNNIPTNNISTLQLKKRLIRKKKSITETSEEIKPPGVYNVIAYATAEEYNLENLLKGLQLQDLYDSKILKTTSDCIHSIAKYQIENEPREIFFFREGSVVFWNITDLESSNILNFLRNYEDNSYTNQLIQKECEIMNYRYHIDTNRSSCLEKNGDFILTVNCQNDETTRNDLILDKYTFSNAMILSVKLGIWEGLLEKFIDSIETITEDLKQGRKIEMTQSEALRKHGELFALRHLINLSSDLLDTPDFYWDNEQLEKLYLQVCSYFCISKRTKVMNEKINHCVELIELLSSHLSDKHHVRLEWMIIILIMVEVAFETIHYVDRYMS